MKRLSLRCPKPSLPLVERPGGTKSCIYLNGEYDEGMHTTGPPNRSTLLPRPCTVQPRRYISTGQPYLRINEDEKFQFFLRALRLPKGG
jgi:hypothetical protein